MFIHSLWLKALSCSGLRSIQQKTLDNKCNLDAIPSQDLRHTYIYPWAQFRVTNHLPMFVCWMKLETLTKPKLKQWKQWKQCLEQMTTEWWCNYVIIVYQNIHQNSSWWHTALPHFILITLQCELSLTFM